MQANSADPGQEASSHVQGLATRSAGMPDHDATAHDSHYSQVSQSGESMLHLHDSPCAALSASTLQAARRQTEQITSVLSHSACSHAKIPTSRVAGSPSNGLNRDRAIRSEAHAGPVGSPAAMNQHGKHSYTPTGTVSTVHNNDDRHSGTSQNLLSGPGLLSESSPDQADIAADVGGAVLSTQVSEYVLQLEMRLDVLVRAAQQVLDAWDKHRWAAASSHLYATSVVDQAPLPGHREISTCALAVVVETDQQTGRQSSTRDGRDDELQALEGHARQTPEQLAAGLIAMATEFAGRVASVHSEGSCHSWAPVQQV
jgi:hypothetical protein